MKNKILLEKTIPNNNLINSVMILIDKNLFDFSSNIINL